MGWGVDKGNEREVIKDFKGNPLLFEGIMKTETLIMISLPILQLQVRF